MRQERAWCWTATAPSGSLGSMANDSSGSASASANPRTVNWALTYVVVCVLAVVVMALLWWFSAQFNVRMPA